MGAQHEILNQEGPVAFEAGAGRDGPGLDDALLMDGQIGALGALASALARRTLLGRGLAGLLHAARLDLGPAFEPHARPPQTTTLVDAPFQKPAERGLTEVEVTDPGHPLFGRRFAVV